jgi:dTDP-4-dehydrorhamnose 3,5-epimerase
METYHRARFAELGIADSFVQDNHSCSAKGTLRGLHYQLHHGQAKLCRVVEGEAFDVAVDVRLGSPHFGKWTSVLLSAKEQNQIYIPTGFAHGFLALTETVQFLYKCSDFYDAGDEHGILWSDPDLNISWGFANPLVSEKDSKYPRLADLPREFLPRYSGK